MRVTRAENTENTSNIAARAADKAAQTAAWVDERTRLAEGRPRR